MREDRAEYLGVGRMAELNRVSKKTLHIYQEKGILEPRLVDPETGYRYYSIDQCSVLDAVTQLKALGFSLEEVRECVLAGDASRLRELTSQKLEAIRAEERRIQMARSLGTHLLEVCDTLLAKPLCDQIMLERIPDRPALVFPVDPVPPDDHLNQKWELAIRSVRLQVEQRWGETALFRSPSGIIPRERLEDGTLLTERACIFVDEGLAALIDDVEVIPGGQYLTMYLDGSLLEDGTSPEYPGIRRMMDYAARKGLAVAGDYVGETIANTPALSYNSRDSFFRLMLPVERARP